ncbi:hypothetical protein BIZ95_gp50 [Pseudomonas phage vB_PaeP_MAG4]|uniref:Uncharacterized protein n=1 Tax=Pseudomonas phage vB_PaeP_MAG4 TaxID=1639814 RepID=A0A172B7V7_9CAUD|nr:hypothetical protein BIZ95_gp50 [Pseudomonas phage vB_PaeP_MAG4]AKH49493.1 hypothetical protein vB_PaeP_fi6_050 [Pseudomonas phage vB_PaeP_MAG4]
MSKYEPVFDSSKVARFYHVRGFAERNGRQVRFFKTTWVGFLETERAYWVVDEDDLKELEHVVRIRKITAASDIRDLAKERYGAFLALKDGSTKRARTSVKAAFFSMICRRERQLTFLERDLNSAQSILLGTRLDTKVAERLEMLNTTTVEIPSSWDIDQQILAEHKRIHENEGHEEGALVWEPDF